MTPLEELIEFVQQYCAAHPNCEKDQLATATAAAVGLVKIRKVYVGQSFSVRFSSASGTSFSNVVLSLSALKAYDDRPFIVCIVRPSGVEFLLANSTLLKKISHSSHQLRTDNVRGSFLGNDIIRNYEGVPNEPKTFELLFQMHSEFSWEENLTRLVQATSDIVGTGSRFSVDSQRAATILAAGSLAKQLSSHSEYLSIGQRLTDAVIQRGDEILRASAIDNVNLRGNRIEQLLTEAGNFHRLDDLVFTLKIGATVVVDIKTKILALQSSPKGYNIDKYLQTLALGQTAISFFFLGLDAPNAAIRTAFASTLDYSILAATRIQFHWAGRNSRGVTQLTGDLSFLFKPTFRETIDLPTAEQFLQKLIDL